MLTSNVPRAVGTLSLLPLRVPLIIQPAGHAAPAGHLFETWHLLRTALEGPRTARVEPAAGRHVGGDGSWLAVLGEQVVVDPRSEPNPVQAPSAP